MWYAVCKLHLIDKFKEKLVWHYLLIDLVAVLTLFGDAVAVGKNLFIDTLPNWSQTKYSFCIFHFQFSEMSKVWFVS